jgi:hypothetical protein
MLSLVIIVGPMRFMGFDPRACVAARHIVEPDTSSPASKRSSRTVDCLS